MFSATPLGPLILEELRCFRGELTQNQRSVVVEEVNLRRR